MITQNQQDILNVLFRSCSNFTGPSLTRCEKEEAEKRRQQTRATPKFEKHKAEVEKFLKERELRSAQEELRRAQEELAKLKKTPMLFPNPLPHTPFDKITNFTKEKHQIKIMNKNVLVTDNDNEENVHLQDVIKVIRQECNERTVTLLCEKKNLRIHFDSIRACGEKTKGMQETEGALTLSEWSKAFVDEAMVVETTIETPDLREGLAEADNI